MKEVQTAGEYTIYQKKSGRYAVKGADRKYVNGDDKAKILLDAGLVELSQPAPQPEPEETTAEASDEVAEDAGEQAAEETKE
ncbi:MAG: hypothetical protein DBW91_05565 [Candidatus Thioglobus sp.]|nr:MAG: hypothetical protein DBW91_05565 [Candidatus Thioglobus sp.]|tara:strand:+ start:1193 stop:1438 length:246 start_codon:yes stop_codon:yes gene_type:complete